MFTVKRIIVPFFLISFFFISTQIAFSAESIKEKIEFGRNLMTMRDYIKAIDKFDEVLAIDKTNPDALFNKSLCNFFLFEYNKALVDLNVLAGIVPDITDVFNLRGLVKMGLKDTTSALQDFNKSIVLDKNHAEAYLNRGKALIHFEKNDEALKDLNKAISLVTTNPDMYYTRARAEHNLGQYLQAVKDFTTAMEFDYFNADTFYRRANSYFKSGDYTHAIDDYTQVIYWEPLNPLAYNNRAYAFDMMGDSLYARQDRQMVNDISIADLLDPEKVKYKLFSNKDSNFAILFPEDFRMIDKSDKDSIFCFFYASLDTANQNRISVEFKIHPFYSKNNDISEPAQLIEKWRQKEDSKGKDIFRYDLTERITKPYKNFPSMLDKILIQKDLHGVPFVEWHYGIAFGEHLIEMNFEIPLAFYFYFSEIYLKSIESLVIRNIK